MAVFIVKLNYKLTGSSSQVKNILSIKRFWQGQEMFATV